VVSHSLFTDDTLIFCEAPSAQILYVRLILQCFEAVSRLRFNLGKSVIVAIGEVENNGALANILGCSVAGLPMKYLGLPLGASYKNMVMWNDMIEQSEHQMAD
jgi:hypothetical protein